MSRRCWPNRRLLLRFAPSSTLVESTRIHSTAIQRRKQPLIYYAVNNTNLLLPLKCDSVDARLIAADYSTQPTTNGDDSKNHQGWDHSILYFFFRAPAHRAQPAVRLAHRRRALHRHSGGERRLPPSLRAVRGGGRDGCGRFE